VTIRISKSKFMARGSHQEGEAWATEKNRGCCPSGNSVARRKSSPTVLLLHAFAKIDLSCKISRVQRNRLRVMALKSTRGVRSRRSSVRRRTRAAISYNMSRIRSTGSNIERHMEQALRSAGLKPHKHGEVTGKPDFLFPEQKVAVFCDSHFWHGYQWRKKKNGLKRNRHFWLSKIQGNIKRDHFVNRTLRQSGWKVLRFWEHQILGAADACVSKIKEAIAIQKREMKPCR
jgi:DNA mismatch endonuclease, patch repair protein